LRPKIGIILGTTRLTRFFSEMRRNGRARRRRIRRSSICALREREIADISIAERIALRWGKKMAERAA
jgi:hypothetical protein